MYMKKASTPYISVVIPTKNEAKLLPACLRSLKNQKTKYSYEVIIVDTRSTDGTQMIARSFGARVIAEKQKGKIYAFRKGASAARGKILAFTEADCVVPPHWIETIATHLDTHDQVAAICGLYTFSKSGILSKIGTFIAHSIGHALHYAYFGHHALRASNFAVRKDIYNKIGGFSLQFFELYDVEIAQRIAKYGDIQVLSGLTTQTSDRRIKGRLFQYLQELFPAILALMQHKPLTKQTYADIR